jgi:hypothetical protein
MLAVAKPVVPIADCDQWGKRDKCRNAGDHKVEGEALKRVQWLFRAGWY